ncbi:hypothetical protein PaG_03236 [Moesziomyces aphidis]|uniref:RanBP2-type domain-containing protein n=1 Tax=Moesziomyces aphidis TaxID=84754 RepID=W3VM06_MOEAP|nr:hypothetical protein PaG_03236 [Moesziomyces aphidis]
MVSPSPPTCDTISGLYADQMAAATRDRCYIDSTPAALQAVPMRKRSANEWASTPPFPTPALTTSSLSSSSLFGEHSPVLDVAFGGQLMQRCNDLASPPGMQASRSFDERPSYAPPMKQPSGSFDPNAPSVHHGDVIHLARSFAGLNMSDRQRYPDYSQTPSFVEPQPPAPLLIPMQPTGAGVPLTSVVETLASKGSKAAAEDPETVAAAYKLSQWGIGIGPGINPKVASSRGGNSGRGRMPASEPPIVNTGNSGPMCVQPGDWICTSCGFVNWRRREVCMRCFPHADGNEIGRGIQGGEMLAKRLAAGLDPDTEEYRQSVQALCPDKVKRGMDTQPQRQMPYNVARTTLATGLGGDLSSYRPSTQSFAQDVGADASNYLGIHLGPQSQHDWRQPINYPGRHVELRSADYYSQLRGMPASYDVQAASQSSCTMPDVNRAGDGPYKPYWPDIGVGNGSRTMSSTSSFAALPEKTFGPTSPRSSHSQERSSARATLVRASTMPDWQEPMDQERYPTPAQQRRSPHGLTAMTWAQASPESTPPLPKEIWAPAPKRPTLVPMEPEDMAREKRAKPQPIGTRSAQRATSTPREDGSSAPGSHASLETA